MKEITDVLTDFFTLMREDIIDYYQKCYSYLKDHITYKRIDLTKKIKSESEKSKKNTLIEMLSAIKASFNTIGISNDKLNESENIFFKYLDEKEVEIPDYITYLEIYLNDYGNKLLFGILFDYIFDIDIKKMYNVNLFDLLPQNFLSKLDNFKLIHTNSFEAIKQIGPLNYNNFINFSDLTIKLDEKEEQDILTQLREAKEDIIETLKTPKKELLIPSKPIIEDKANSNTEPVQLEIKEQFTPIPKFNQKLRVNMQKEHQIRIEQYTGTFLDEFGKFLPGHYEIINKFKINSDNLVNLNLIQRDYFDLENLFYFISILRLLDLKLPFTNSDILDIIESFTNGNQFSPLKVEILDSKNIFYCLAILSELSLLKEAKFFNLPDIEKYLILKLEKIIPERLELNLYSILSLKILKASQKSTIDKEKLLNSISDLNIFSLEDFKPILDIYNHLSSIKLLDKEVNMDLYESIYLSEIKKLKMPNCSIGNSITDSARVLLILDLLNLRESEPELCSNLLNYILNKTSFFDEKNLNNGFNWRNDKLGYKIELKILFWALLASCQYAPKKF